MTRALRDFTELSTSFEAVAQSTKTLPADLRRELTEFVKSTDAAQARLADMLREAAEVTESLTKAGVAWDATAKSVSGVVTAINDMNTAETHDASGDESSFDVNDYTRAADAIRSGATEVRSLLHDLEAGRLAGSLEAVGTTADLSIDRAAERSEALIDRITIRLAIVIGLSFAALLAYRSIASRVTAR